jgi:hypothetical protein
MFRVIFDKEKSEFKMKIYPFEKGIAGYVAYSGQTCFVDTVHDDNRFCKEVDDPKGSHPHQIIAVPIFCSSDRFDTSIAASIPRAVVSVIDSHELNGFTQRVNYYLPYIIFL